MKVNASRRRFLSGAVRILGAAAATGPISVYAQGTSRQTLAVKIINSNATPQLAFEELLKRQGYLEQLGLEATTVNVADGSKIMASLISGGMDVCMISGFGQVLPADERGAQIKVIAAASLLIAQGVLTNRPTIKSIADLVGKKIGAGSIGSLEQQLMVAILLAHNVDPASVTFVNIGNTSDIFRAVVAGVVDAGPVNIDVYGKQKGDLKIIANFWNDVPNYPDKGSFASTDAIKNKREAIVRTLAAYCKAYRFLRTPESKDVYIQSYLAAVGGAAADAEFQWQFIYDNKAFAADLVLPDSSLQFMQNLNLRTGIQNTELPLDRLEDMSLSRDALKLIS